MFRRVTEYCSRYQVPKVTNTEYYKKIQMRPKAEFGPWYNDDVKTGSMILGTIIGLYYGL